MAAPRLPLYEPIEILTGARLDETGDGPMTYEAAARAAFLEETSRLAEVDRLCDETGGFDTPDELRAALDVTRCGVRWVTTLDHSDRRLASLRLLTRSLQGVKRGV